MHCEWSKKKRFMSSDYAKVNTEAVKLRQYMEGNFSI